MPDQEQTNLSLLTGMNTQLEAITQALSRAQQDKAFNQTLLGSNRPIDMFLNLGRVRRRPTSSWPLYKSSSPHCGRNIRTNILTSLN